MIHPTALIDPSARIGAQVTIGPYSVVGPNVSIDERTWIGPHVVIEGHTTIGTENRIYQFSSVGKRPQDKKYRGEPTRLVIGNRNTIHEFVSLHVGTEQGGGVTTIGDDNWVMSYCHVAHDCRIANHCILANSAQLAGHVDIGDWAMLGGFTGVHQFVKVGAHALTGGGTILFQDVPPYVTVQGNPAQARGINAEGLRRRGFSDATINALRRAYRVIYREGRLLNEARELLATQVHDTPEMAVLVRFLMGATRGIVR